MPIFFTVGVKQRSRALQIHSTKYAFNEQLIALRDKKIGIVSEVADLVDQLEKIQAILGPLLSKPVPTVPVIHPCETPEK